MNWEAVGTVAEIVGAVAVVVTLYYLAVQIRDSSAQFRRSELNTTFQRVSPARLAIAENEQLASVLAKGLSDLQTLNDAEAIQFNAIMSERVWITFYTWQQFQEGLVTKHSWDGLKKASTLSSLKTPGGSAWLELEKGQFPLAYQEELKKISESRDDDT